MRADLPTDRLLLRPFADRDLDDAVAIFTDACVKQTYMLPDFADAGQAARLFRHMQALSRCEDRFVRAICLDDRMIGFINDVAIDGSELELGYVIHPTHQGCGYATEALSAAIGCLFAAGYTRVTAGYFAENAASRRVMEKCGMQPLSRSEEVLYRGAVHTCHYCAIDR